MVRNSAQEELRLAAQARGEADHVLSRLIDSRLATERRLRDTGRPDPLKVLTGSSALDRAIATTREIIRRMDDLLGELRDESPAPENSREPAALADFIKEAPSQPLLTPVTTSP
ncbi:MAG: hypothetical protein GY715_17800 [Planctomycetes bacterium]|nr:hypothetical protein [Planctomycetota bacterium]